MPFAAIRPLLLELAYSSDAAARLFRSAVLHAPGAPLRAPEGCGELCTLADRMAAQTRTVLDQIAASRLAFELDPPAAPEDTLASRLAARRSLVRPEQPAPHRPRFH